MKKTWLVMTAKYTFIVIVLSIVLLSPSLLYSNVYKGVSLEGVDVSGCSREEIIQLLLLWQKEHHNKYITVSYGETMFKVDASSIDFDIDVDATLEEVWNYGRTGWLWERVKKIWTARREGYSISVIVKYNETKLTHLIEEWQGEIERPPRNATLSLVTGGLVPEQQGRRLESSALRPLVIQAFIKSETDAVALPVTTIYPEVTVDDITTTGISEALSRYTTSFNTQDSNRSANIKLAAWKVNGHIVYPGKIFSFNEIVGPREKTYGFKEAMEIIDGEFVPGVGGGICQLSSTLYNAVLLANLQIVERHNHSKPLSYVSLGRDATVVFGSLDFKFRNNTAEPVMVMAEVNGNKLMVGIFGRHRSSQTVEILSLEQQDIAPAIIRKYDDTLYLGETKVDKQGKAGYNVTTVRIVKSQGKEIKREVLSKDQYLPDNTVIKVGTQIPPFVKEKG